MIPDREDPDLWGCYTEGLKPLSIPDMALRCEAATVSTEMHRQILVKLMTMVVSRLRGGAASVGPMRVVFPTGGVFDLVLREVPNLPQDRIIEIAGYCR